MPGDTEVMQRLVRSSAVFVVVAAGIQAGQARSQAPTVDTSVPAHPGGSGSLLGQAPGDRGSTLGPGPGAGGGGFDNAPVGGILGGRPGASTPKGVPTSITRSGEQAGPTALQTPVSAPAPQPVSPTAQPFYGTLEITSGAEDEGAEGGLTLDRAIDVTLKRSLDLRAKYQEIPMARADTLQASLRSNPIFYQDGQLLQYRGASTQFTRAAPGGPSQYDTNITYPLDISHKRQARTEVATRAERVLEAQFQDAVRNRVDDVYEAYVTALGARQTARYAAKSVKGLEQMVTLTEHLLKQGQIPLSDLNLVKIKLQTARLGRIDADTAYRKARLTLGSLMNLSNEEARSFELKGSIEDTAAPPPPLDELTRLALELRPDVISYRLGISRAEADVRLAKANALSDFYVLWQPYTFQDNSPYGLKSQYSWALGVTVPLPIYNRNQGGIERAKINVGQSQIQLADLERQLRIDVESAFLEYEVTKRLVDDLRNIVEPEARQVRDSAFKLWLGGGSSLIAYLQAQLEYNAVVKQYLDTAIRHRQSMLSLNTTVGRRIMP
jgi:outer membrane protein, heavy metal efflux system